MQPTLVILPWRRLVNPRRRQHQQVKRSQTCLLQNCAQSWTRNHHYPSSQTQRKLSFSTFLSTQAHPLLLPFLDHLFPMLFVKLPQLHHLSVTLMIQLLLKNKLKLLVSSSEFPPHCNCIVLHCPKSNNIFYLLNCNFHALEGSLTICKTANNSKNINIIRLRDNIK